ncbi:hypothetical protein A2U01_0112497, partial [Trifolium medium]|nr:hypothetical protein [Trifolium medium]
FHTGHRCAKKQFLLLLMDEPDEEVVPTVFDAGTPMSEALQLLPEPTSASPLPDSSALASSEHFQLSHAA